MDVSRICSSEGRAGLDIVGEAVSATDWDRDAGAARELAAAAAAGRGQMSTLLCRE